MYTGVLLCFVVFTDAQRLKGLTKQLANLGYGVTKSSDSSIVAQEEGPAPSSDEGDRWDMLESEDPAEKKIDELQRLSESF